MDRTRPNPNNQWKLRPPKHSCHRRCTNTQRDVKRGRDISIWMSNDFDLYCSGNKRNIVDKKRGIENKVETIVLPSLPLFSSVLLFCGWCFVVLNFFTISLDFHWPFFLALKQNDDGKNQTLEQWIKSKFVCLSKLLWHKLNEWMNERARERERERKITQTQTRQENASKKTVTPRKKNTLESSWIVFLFCSMIEREDCWQARMLLWLGCRSSKNQKIFCVERESEEFS